jgi:hypothetical protein
MPLTLSELRENLDGLVSRREISEAEFTRQVYDRIP